MCRVFFILQFSNFLLICVEGLFDLEQNFGPMVEDDFPQPNQDEILCQYEVWADLIPGTGPMVEDDFPQPNQDEILCQYEVWAGLLPERKIHLPFCVHNVYLFLFTAFKGTVF